MKMSKSFKVLSVLTIAAMLVIAGCGNNKGKKMNLRQAAMQAEGQLLTLRPLPRSRSAASCSSA
ncbi:hypothetical protein ACFTAO_01790 [Paenibacillus rhizoplanae]